MLHWQANGCATHSTCHSARQKDQRYLPPMICCDAQCKQAFTAVLFLVGGRQIVFLLCLHSNSISDMFVGLLRNLIDQVAKGTKVQTQKIIKHVHLIATTIKLSQTTSGSRIWSKGGAQKFFPRFCRRSEAESRERSKPILAGVQGPP